MPLNIINQHVIMFNNRLHMTLVELYVGQSAVSFMRDIVYTYRRVNECRSWMYKPHGSKIGSSKQIVEECKYLLMNGIMLIS